MRVPARLFARGWFISLALGCLHAAPVSRGTAGPGPLLPDLVPQLPEDIANDRNNRDLRLTATIQNLGDGPCELQGPGRNSRSKLPQPAAQNVYDGAGNHASVPVGKFVWHPAHAHWHFLPELARYEIR